MSMFLTYSRAPIYAWRQSQSTPAAPGTGDQRLTFALYSRAGSLVWPRRHDGAGGSNSYNVGVTEAATATDAVSAVATLVAAMSEAASASDAVSALVDFMAAMSEGLSAADSITVAALYGAAQAEAASASDAQSTTLEMPAAVTEAASAADATNWGGAIYAVDVDEAATLSDAVSAALQLLGAMVEAGGAGDTHAVALVAGATLTEAATAIETVTGSNPQTYSVTISEAASAIDTITVALVSGGVVVLSAPPSGRRLQASARVNVQAGGRPRNRSGSTR